jgi:DNA repair protein RadA/Sms
MSTMKLTITSEVKRGTNIMSIDVPPQLEKTVECGVSFIDDCMGGAGFTPSTICLFTGTSGAGKSTCMLQIAESITASGNICLFNTAEESLMQVRKVTKRLGCKAGFVVGADTKVSDIIEHARFLQKKNPNKQLFIVIDSLQCLDDGKYDNGHTNSMTAVRSAELLADFAKETYAVVIIIGQVNKNGDFAGKNQIKHTVDVHAHLFIDDQKKSETYGMRVLEVTKNRFGSAGRAYVLDMTAKGLVEVASL